MNRSPDRLEIEPRGPLQSSIRPPGSKSITNRALVCAALAAGQSELIGALESEDTRVMTDALRQLGLTIEHSPTRETLLVDGCQGKLPVTEAQLFVANSGTSMRFLTAMLAACSGRFRLDGIPRMRERPIGDLLDALAQLGVDVRSEAENGCPPVLITSQGLPGGSARIRGNTSSQYLSGLLLAAPCAHRDVSLQVDGELVSRPYVTLTVRVMEAFGVQVRESGDTYFVASGQSYGNARYEIEPDASAASYFWAAAAIAGGTVRVEGLHRHSLQGDVRFCECLERMGCTVSQSEDGLMVTGGTLRGIDVDMKAISDTVQTLATVALFANGPTRITGVGHIRHKETDRIGDLARELRRLGARVDESADGLTIRPQRLVGCEIETYDDHRMAMSLALVGLVVPRVIIKDPGCTRKTYPNFWSDLASLELA